MNCRQPRVSMRLALEREVTHPPLRRAPIKRLEDSLDESQHLFRVKRLFQVSTYSRPPCLKGFGIICRAGKHHDRYAIGGLACLQLTHHIETTLAWQHISKDDQIWVPFFDYLKRLNAIARLGDIVPLALKIVPYKLPDP